jgi:hypothetical protein
MIIIIITKRRSIVPYEARRVSEKMGRVRLLSNMNYSYPFSVRVKFFQGVKRGDGGLPQK